MTNEEIEKAAMDTDELSLNISDAFEAGVKWALKQTNIKINE